MKGEPRQASKASRLQTEGDIYQNPNRPYGFHHNQPTPTVTLDFRGKKSKHSTQLQHYTFKQIIM